MSSRFLTMILRHRAADFGIPIDENGWVAVSDLIPFVRRQQTEPFTIDTLHNIVAADRKHRFEFSRDGNRVRACQGHSMGHLKMSDLRKLSVSDVPLFPTVVHGTDEEALEAIRRCGYMSRMGRLHMHFAVGEPKDSAVVSGMRSSASVYIYLDLEKAIRSGVDFYLSSNNVILTEGIDGGKLPLSFVRKITVLGQR